MSRDRHGRMPGKVRRRPAIGDRRLHSRERRNGPIARRRVGLPPIRRTGPWPIRPIPPPAAIGATCILN